ncbi:MAG: hemolysin family protein [Clostridia bacterium]|nr:hemolysin family protein [Clostridia bacterium]MDE7328786.1 hemolysin family protein [Clostridia bacterium]
MVVPLSSTVSSIDGPTLTGYIVAIVILIFLSGFFSSTETAFSSLNRIRLKNLVSTEKKKYAKTYFLSEHFDALISTILIGNNIVNITATTLATIMFSALISNQNAAGAVSTAVITIVVLIFGEVIPKSTAKRSPEYFARLTAPFILALYYVLYPFVWIMGLLQKLIGKLFKKKGVENITDEELITYVDEAQTEGGLDEYEGDLIRSAIEFDNMTVREVFTPRVDVEAIDVDSSMAEVMKVFRESGYTRLPVYKDNIDTIVGVLNLKDFYEAYIDGASKFNRLIAKNVIYVPDSMKISDVLRKLQIAKMHIAIVADEFGGTMGIVTLEDILEQLVGEIYDERDEIVEPIVKVTDQKYFVLGEINLEEFFEFFKVNEAGEEFDAVTLSGYIAFALGRLPQVGDIVNFEKLAITVKKMDNTVVEKVEVVINVEEEDSEE